MTKYQVKSSIIIAAPLKKVYDHVKDFNTWRDWSPWSICDPEHEGSVTGKAGEVGQKTSWDSKIIGSGENTIEKVEKDAIHYDLQFFKPFKSKAKTKLLFKEVKTGTKVTWTMDSSMPFFMSFMIKPMKNWIEMDYKRGLIMLKAIMEEGKVDAETTNKGVEAFEGFSYIGIQRTCTFKDMPILMKQDFMDIVSKIVFEEGKSAKHWITVYPKVNMRKKLFTFVAAVSDEDLGDMVLPEGWVRGDIESRDMLQIKHRGAYDFLGNAWSMGMMYLRGMKMKQKGKAFEYYWNSPMEVKPEELETSIFFPLK